MKLNSQRGKKPNLLTGALIRRLATATQQPDASIHHLSAITQPPVEKTVLSLFSFTEKNSVNFLH
jgi:hypothetical protein